MFVKLISKKGVVDIGFDLKNVVLICIWECFLGFVWLLFSEIIWSGVKCVVFNMFICGLFKFIGLLKVKNVFGYERDRECVENGWLGIELGNSFWVWIGCEFNCVLLWLKVEFWFIKWWLLFCWWMSCNSMCCWLVVCCGCDEKEGDENFWVVGEGWGRIILCWGWKCVCSDCCCCSCGCCCVVLEVGWVGIIIWVNVFRVVCFCCLFLFSWVVSVCWGKFVFGDCMSKLLILIGCFWNVEDNEDIFCIVFKFVFGCLFCSFLVLLFFVFLFGIFCLLVMLFVVLMLGFSRIFFFDVFGEIFIFGVLFELVFMDFCGLLLLIVVLVFVDKEFWEDVMIL